MTPDDERLLASYAEGPRIWDAAALAPAVYRLADQGLIEPGPPADDGGPPSRGAYRLTARGRQALGLLAACTVRGNHGPPGDCPGVLFPRVPGSRHDDRQAGHG
jgi:hypothetical protein